MNDIGEAAIDFMVSPSPIGVNINVPGAKTEFINNLNFPNIKIRNFQNQKKSSFLSDLSKIDFPRCQGPSS